MKPGKKNALSMSLNPFVQVFYSNDGIMMYMIFDGNLVLIPLFRSFILIKEYDYYRETT